MDDYDLVHAVTFDATLNVYDTDNIENRISEFLTELYIDETHRDNIYLRGELARCIMEMKNGLCILDYRHITNIGSRIIHYINAENENNVSIKKTYLVQVWRGSSSHFN